MLDIRDLSGGYGRLNVFRDVNLTLEKGQTVGLLGVNGAGKTTLLKSIMGALPTNSGSVCLNNQDLTNVSVFRRTRLGLTLVPEGRHVFGSLTVKDNLDLTRSAGLQREVNVSFDGRLAEVFDLFPRLNERKNQLGASLSGGEQQMLAVARALLLNPDVLMLDEPTQGLAPIVIQAMSQTLSQLKGRFAMLIVEQNRAFLERMTDCIWTMQAGRLNARQ